MEETGNNSLVTKLVNLKLAFKEFIDDEKVYSLKVNLLKLCDKYAITPKELFDFIETVDIEHEQTSATSSGGSGGWLGSGSMTTDYIGDGEFGEDGYDEDDFDRKGYDRQGFDKLGFDESGYNKEGKHRGF